MILESYRDHREKMATADLLTDDSQIIKEIMQVLEPVLERINKEVVKRPLKEPVHQASHSASFGSTRSQGGQAGELRRRIDEEFGTTLQSSLSKLDPELGSMEATMDEIARKQQSVRLAKGISRIHVGVKAGRGARSLSNYFDSEAVKLWPQAVRECAHRDLDTSGGRFMAKIQAVLEPLKCRIISKGPAAPYYFSKPLQERLHDTMRKMNCFRLIGRPVSPTDLMDIAERDDDKSWFSGDYSAATDALSATLSAQILARLTEGLPEEDREVYAQVLKPHHVVYPPVYETIRDEHGEKVVKTTVEEVDQLSGQLMGSILSFPVLCLANLGLYLRTRLNKQIETQTLAKRDVMRALGKVLINGDDILYCATQEEFERHCEIGGVIGLKMNVGKTYMHKRYANINSVSFDYDLQGPSTPKQIGFFNTGLFFVQNKVMERVGGEEDHADDVEDVGRTPAISVINELLEGVWTGKTRGARVLADYLSLHGAQITKEQKGRSLFLSESFGGFGVKAPLGFTERITKEQFLYANAIERVMDDTLSVQPLVRPMNYVTRKSTTKYLEPWSDRDISRELRRLRVKITGRNSSLEKFFSKSANTKRRWKEWIRSKTQPQVVVAPGALVGTVTASQLREIEDLPRGFTHLSVDEMSSAFQAGLYSDELKGEVQYWQYR
jgi:hypothetical protein